MQSMTTGNFDNIRLTSVKKDFQRKKDLKLNQPITSKQQRKKIITIKPQPTEYKQATKI